MRAGTYVRKANVGVGGDNGRAVVDLIIEHSCRETALGEKIGIVQPDVANFYLHGGHVLSGIVRLEEQPGS